MNRTDTPMDPADTTARALKDLHRNCFACGVCNRAGLNLHFYVDTEGTACAVWTPTSEFRSYPDRVHGGILATVLDSAIVHALFAKGIKGVTAESLIRYRKSVNVNDPVRVIGWVESERLGLYQCRAELYQPDVLAVRAISKFMSMPDNVHGKP